MSVVLWGSLKGRDLMHISFSVKAILQNANPNPNDRCRVEWLSPSIRHLLSLPGAGQLDSCWLSSVVVVGDKITYPGLTQLNLTYERMKVDLKTWKSSPTKAIPNMPLHAIWLTSSKPHKISSSKSLHPKRKLITFFHCKNPPLQMTATSCWAALLLAGTNRCQLEVVTQNFML